MKVIRFNPARPSSEAERSRSPRNEDQTSVMRRRIDVTRAFLADSDHTLHVLRETTRGTRGRSTTDD
jgi:hypothetical protein